MNDSTNTQSVQVAEIQGLYGPVTVSESLIQRIWLRGDYQQDSMKTDSGKPLRVRHPGRWNKQEGPDFLGADLYVGNKRVRGDVEIHFYEEDWRKHGHHAQETFDGVILHVLVFPPKVGSPAQTQSGIRPEVVTLLPYLNCDLESYASDEALHAWDNQDAASLLEGFLHLSLAQREERLVGNARQRFGQKVAFVRQRLETSPWNQVCHQLTLEVLGYRRNRAPMSSIALRWPPEALAGADVEALFQSYQEQWKLAGLRPANHPRLRLQQFQQLLRTQPDWQARLLAWAKSQRISEGTFSRDTKAYRKSKRLTAQRRELSDQILAGVLGGTRLDTWMVDAALPLLAVDQPDAWFPLWFHWFCGDMPEAVNTFLSQSQMPPHPQPRANGWSQGAWQLFLESCL